MVNLKGLLREFAFLIGAGLFCLNGCGQPEQKEDQRFLTFQVNPRKSPIEMYWKNDDGQRFGSIKGLKVALALNKRVLRFAVNGGMFKADGSPLGLYIENGVVKAALDTSSGKGNFYLKPNGVFFIKQNNSAGICPTSDFYWQRDIKFATQSGPLLLSYGEIHPAFNPASKNLNIRNGVGILPDNSVIFATSTQPVILFDFANFLKQSGCQFALYLDGFVSRTYLPEKGWYQLDGDFGVIIAVTYLK
ncbi:MAG: hypothetical protein EOO88_01230 [Pedobacter sp.]|nr:MAG: hypothetical protein EOO88_01230 [Pedobacter sp.]